jgi:hypothetical protein
MVTIFIGNINQYKIVLITILTIFFINCLCCFEELEESDHCTPRCICTHEFRTYFVYVKDTNNNPADLVNISITTENNNNPLTFNYIPQYISGQYLIFGDEKGILIKRDRELNVFVNINKGDISLTENYVFAMDSCCCHVDKLLGKDTVILQ